VIACTSVFSVCADKACITDFNIIIVVVSIICGVISIVFCSLCLWTLQTANIVSTWKRRKLAPSWQPLVLEAHPVVEFDRLGTAADPTALAAVAHDPLDLQASDALTDNRCRRRLWTVSCRKLPIRALLRVVLASSMWYFQSLHFSGGF